PDAAVAGWAADRLLFRRAMNVNAATKSVSVLTFEAAQPEDACNHRIATRRIWCKNFTREAPVMKNSADWCMVTNFLRHSQVTKRSRHSSPKIAQSELGCGNGISCHFCAVLQEHQLLIADAY